ncbi:MAG: flavodoxin-dependent (E)-4-hydroxy-3-methylbut-2-enyl-diphosphate synthase [Elusimicrobia bacterium]|nr:flavodoxin-dependent (E)-4-hydroxy-3-methylbut-2-enyl-diphosphate synthase [Elusimicrobiota bacterium]
MNTRKVSIGSVEVGGGNPLRVQTMLKSPFEFPEQLFSEAEELVAAGAEMIRVAIPTVKDVGIYSLLSELKVPLIADCHFSGDIAEKSLKAGFKKIRINPGNTSEKDIFDAFRMADSYGASIRLGFNSGSCGARDAEGIATQALDWDEKIQKAGYKNFLVSMKSSSVLDTVDANRFFSVRSDTPLHIGVTATGPRDSGILKSAVGLGALLIDGVGDTIRVSLTSDSLDEVRTAIQLKEITSGQHKGIEFISCPACSRNRINVKKTLDELMSGLTDSDKRKNISVAVMGCEVNGPGEASHCDIGLCGTRSGGLIIKKGKVMTGTKDGKVMDRLIEEIRKL